MITKNNNSASQDTALASSQLVVLLMQTSQLPSPRSTTSLTRNVPPRTNGLDPFHGLENRDFCNVFWGLGDVGPNVLFARMRGAERTTNELQRFWQER